MVTEIRVFRGTRRQGRPVTGLVCSTPSVMIPGATQSALEETTMQAALLRLLETGAVLTGRQALVSES